MKKCLVFSAYVPENLLSRGLDYLNLIMKYFKDDDIYIGLNYQTCDKFIDQLKKYKNITFGRCYSYLSTNSDNSGYQKALELLKQSNKQYDYVYMSHTKSITHICDYYSGIKYIEDEFYKKINEIENIFKNEKIGGWSFYGDVRLDLEQPNTVLDQYYNFEFKSIQVCYWLTSYVIRGSIIDNFIKNCDISFFNKQYINRYFYESYFPDIISKSGFIPYFENHYNNAKESQKYDTIYNELVKYTIKD